MRARLHDGFGKNESMTGKGKWLISIWCIWTCAGLVAGVLFATLMSLTVEGPLGLTGWIGMALAFGIPWGLLMAVVASLWILRLPEPICPECGAPLPLFRKPRTFKQGLWGGVTCRQCACELDRKMQEITPSG
jgi:hypothetical protein